MKATTLEHFFENHSHIVVLTGAGISAASGIPTYRDHEGQWQYSTPIEHQAFLDQSCQRRRYWTRSALGWPHVDKATPNQAHYELTKWEQAGRIPLLVTQNVDRLHQRSGHQRVIDLHGRLDRVTCLSCHSYFERKLLQTRLLNDNPHLLDAVANAVARVSTDGDAHVEDELTSSTKLPLCEKCKGTLMPDVVFFGGAVPKIRVNEVMAALEKADALMVVGSSLTLYSGYRFCKAAHAMGKPIVIINKGTTRADSLSTLKIKSDCTQVLMSLSNSK
jgi:NAD-dependent SIR2 family protein deacetylase